MEATEVDRLIGELEVGVDRLRSLYEQYFMGFEKLEPTVPRKDVDRKIHALRKEQIRNTALRFRFQMILQRYNTYQTHWQRICREIDNGTYKRHLSRAQRRFASESPRSDLPRRSTSRSEAAPSPSSVPVDSAATSPSSVPVEAVTSPSSVPVDSASSPLPAPVARPQPGARLPEDLAAELAELDKEFAPAGPAPPRAAPRLPTPASPVAVPAPEPRRDFAAELAELDKEFAPAAAKAPAVAKAPAAPHAPAGASPPAAAKAPAAAHAPAGASPPIAPQRRDAGRSPTKGTAPAPVRSPNPIAPPLPVVKGHPRPAAERTDAAPPPGPPHRPAPATAAERTDAAPPPGPPHRPAPATAAERTDAAPPPGPPHRPAPATAAGPAKPQGAGAPPAAVTSTATKPGPPTAPAVPPRPAVARPSVRAPGPAPSPSVRAQSPPTPPRTAGDDLSDDRLKQLYSQYVDARRRQKESTVDVSFDAVAKNLRESGARLREKHGKAVDFEVMVKDGKTFLRPVIK